MIYLHFLCICHLWLNFRLICVLIITFYIWLGEKVFEVSHISMIGDKYTVNIDTQHYSCKKWLIIAIPCCHTIVAMKFYLWRNIWVHYLPVNGHLFGKKTSFPKVHPPFKRRLPRRPKKKNKVGRLRVWKNDT